MVKRYIKLPVEVEAIQVTEDNAVEVTRFCPTFTFYRTRKTGPRFSLKSREGVVYGYIGDWVLKGDGGLFWINAHDIFPDNYQEVER